MDTELMLDVSQAHEFKLACRRSGYTNADIKRMCEGDTLVRLLPAVRGFGEVIIKYIVDLAANPMVPDGWSVEDHIKGGQFEWDPTKVGLHLDKGQKDGKYFEGNKLRKKLKDQSTFNANLLDYLLANPHLIPEEWKGKYVFFWGTIYRRSVGHLCVRCLYWRDGQWRWHCHWLDGDFDGRSPAAVSASS